MTASTDPTDAVVSITWQEVSGNTVTTEQGSGVLIAPDEVLTAAHLVYDGAGHLVTGAVVSSAAGGTLHAVGVEASVQAMPLADWTQVASAAGDFAVIHLAAPVAGLPTMALASGSANTAAGAAVTVTGFPRATAGAEDSLAETLTPLAGSNGILQGTPLGAPGDPHGASGGPAWQTVGGVPTVLGLSSSASGTTAFFVGLTAADVAQVDAWVAADHAAPAAQTAVVQASAAQQTATQPAAAQAASAATVATPAASPASDAVAALAAEAAALPAVAAHPAVDAAMSRVVSLLTRDAAALGTGAGFDDVAAEALPALGDNSVHRNLAAALLEGVVWGHDGGGVGGALSGVAGSDPGLTSYAVAGRAVHAGAVLGDRLLASGF